RRPAAGRADAGDRRGLEGADLPADRRPGLEGAEGGAAGLELRPGAPGHLRPDRGDVPGPARTRAPGRRPGRASADARSDGGAGGMSGRSLLSKMGPLLGLIGVFVFFTV